MEIHHPHIPTYYKEYMHKSVPVTFIKPTFALKKVNLISTHGLENFATHHRIVARKDNFQKNPKNQNKRIDEKLNEREEFDEIKEEEEVKRPQQQRPSPPQQQQQRPPQQSPQQQQRPRPKTYRRVPKNVLHRYAPNARNYRAF